jgi:glutamyl-tRNA synthetase
MTIVTRFAPSPTGFLHIGGARTAYFNWLLAKSTGGKFLLRIEDTDRERSTQEATQAILEGMNWLGLAPDEEIVYQSANSGRHVEVAQELLARGQAYKCFATKEEIEQFRQEHPHAKFRSPWRDRAEDTHPQGQNYAIRIKANLEGTTTIEDRVQGTVSVENSQLDDMIILRSDGTPTYMLAVVVDDHDMGVNFVLRGDDHLTNTFRQNQLYEALGWPKPEYAHIPLIHGSDGAKLSKRHGALGVEAYREMGYLPEALKNYLLRLGWSSGDEEIIPEAKAVELFKISGIGKSPSRFDMDKLNHINNHYMQQCRPEELVKLMNDIHPGEALDGIYAARVQKGIKSLIERSKTLLELRDNAQIYVEYARELDDKSRNILASVELDFIKRLMDALKDVDQAWNEDLLSAFCKEFAKANEVKMPQVMQTLRATVVGTFNAPSITEVMAVLGKEETLTRMESALRT